MKLALRVSSFVLLVFAPGCSGTPVPPHATDQTQTDSAEAKRILGELRTHFPRMFEPNQNQARPRRDSANALIEVPETAASEFTIESKTSSVGMSVKLSRARDVKASAADGYVVYPRGGPGGSVLLHKPSERGSEDYLVFERAPEHARVVYQVALSSAVAGLRLVANTLEALDQHSAPRLRVTQPYLVDAAGRRRDAQLEVIGCAVDRNPAAPWGRAPVSPGASRCELHVAWDDAGLEYPMVLDPAWNVTGSMSIQRAAHSGTLLSGQRALVVGGWTGATTTDGAEIYDFATKSWAVTTSMSTPRRSFTLTLLGSDRVIAIGGSDETGELSTAEIYDSTTGRWTSTAEMAQARCRHSATIINDDLVLVAGGKADRAALASAELYSVSSGEWSHAPKMLAPEVDHTATLTSDGQVLVVGPTLPAAQLYNRFVNRWYPAAAPAFARRRHTATAMSEASQILIAGGIERGGDELAAVEIYDVATDSWARWSSMIDGHERHSADMLSDGRVIVIGSSDLARSSKVEAYNDVWGTWAPLPDVPVPGGTFGHVSVASGTTLLVAGGTSAATGRPVRDAAELDASRTPTSLGEYKFPAAVDPDVLPETETELWAAVYRPTILEPGKRHPLLLFAHGNHSTCGPNCSVTVPNCCEYTWSGTCSSGLSPLPSHLGFGYIAEELAARGYVVVSINSNRGITCGAAATDFSARSAQVLKHLQLLSAWDRGVTATPSSIGASLQGALDFDHVGLLGHSRGGDAVRAAYQQYIAAGSPWPGRIVTAITFRGVFEIAPTDDHPAPGLNNNLAWNTLVPMCDGDVFRLDGVRVFDRSLLELNEANPTRKSALVVWGANHNFYNIEWKESEGSQCLGHRALFSTAGSGSPEQRQTAFFPVLAFFLSNVQPDPDPVLGRLFDSRFGSLAEPRADRAQIPAANSQYSLPLEDFSAPTGTSSRGFENLASNVTVDHLSAPATLGIVINDPSLRVAALRWQAAGESTYFQTNWADGGAGLDLSSFERLEFRVDRLKHNLNPTPTTDFSVQLVNSNGSLSDKLPISAYTTIDGPVGAILATGATRTRPWLPTASISLSAFTGARLEAIRGLRLTFDSTATGMIRVASVRVSRAVSSPADMTIARLAHTAQPFAGTGIAFEDVVPSDAPGPHSDAVRHTSGNSIDALRAKNDSTFTLTLRAAKPYAARAAYLVLSIGGEIVSADSLHPRGDLSRVEFSIPRATFDRLAEGAEISVHYGRSAADEVWEYGPLLKASLDP